VIQVTYRLSPRRFGKWQKELGERVPAAIDRGLTAAGRFAVQSAQLRTAWKGKTDLRGFISGFGFAVLPDHTLQVFNRAEHARFVEGGRGSSVKLPPIRLISEWAARKLGNYALGWPIAKAIAKRGIKPTPIMTSPAFAAKLREMAQREVRKALESAYKRSRGA
jgi:hypothetical protein